MIIGIAAIFSLLLNYLLIPSYGMLGAALASFFSYLLMDLLAYLINIRIYPVPYEGLRILKIIVVTALFILIFNYIQTSSWEKELIYKLFALLFYPLLLWTLGFFSKSELIRAKDFIYELLTKLRLKKKTA